MFHIAASSEQISIHDINKPLLVSFESNLETNENAIFFKKTLDNNNWEYVFMNTGPIFKDFSDRIQGYLSYLNTLPDEKIVILSDARDVLCCRSPFAFIEGLNDLNKNERKIVVSTELFLIGHMNWTPAEMDEKIKINPNYFYQGTVLNKYWEYYKYDIPPDKKYVNAGLLAGKVCQLREMFNWIHENDYNDDQLGLANYVNNFPHLINLDINNEILHTSSYAVNGGMYDVRIQQKDSPSIAELFGYSSFFLHMPGIYMSKGQSLCYSVIKDVVSNNYGEKMRGVYGCTSNTIFNNVYLK
jgi:hypothetical protein